MIAPLQDQPKREPIRNPADELYGISRHGLIALPGSSDIEIMPAGS